MVIKAALQGQQLEAVTQACCWDLSAADSAVATDGASYHSGTLLLYKGLSPHMTAGMGTQVHAPLICDAICRLRVCVSDMALGGATDSAQGLLQQGQIESMQSSLCQ
jgi:hypothetical protein